MSEITREQPAVVRVLCSDGAEYDQYVYSFDHDQATLLSIVDAELDTLYIVEDEPEVKTFDDMVMSLARQGIHLLGIADSSKSY